jgi:hypothetical protein
VRNEVVVVLGQKKLLQRLLPGLTHAFIFWGFVALFPTIIMAMIGIVDKESTIPWLGHQGWFALLADLFAVLVLIGVLVAAYIRKVVRPARFQGSHLGEADLILALIGGIVVTLLLWHSTRIALGLNEWPADWSPISNRARPRLGARADHPRLHGIPAPLEAPAHLHRGGERLLRAYPCTRPHRAAPLRRPRRARGGDSDGRGDRRRHDVEAGDRHECGRCQDVCPAWATGKELSPKLLIMGLRDHLFEEGPKVLAGTDPAETPPLVPNAVTDGVVWDCVTCGACASSTSTTSSTCAATW